MQSQVSSALPGIAEDGLLEEDEMSQLSGRTLDLRNSAALLKLARMSVDATALQDSELLLHAVALTPLRGRDNMCRGFVVQWVKS